jgi:hypothetical protein
LFFLSKWGLSPEYLYSIPISTFMLYVRLYDDHAKQIEFERMSAEHQGPKEDKKTIGQMMPRG